MSKERETPDTKFNTWSRQDLHEYIHELEAARVTNEHEIKRLQTHVVLSCQVIRQMDELAGYRNEVKNLQNTMLVKYAAADALDRACKN